MGKFVSKFGVFLLGSVPKFPEAQRGDQNPEGTPPGPRAEAEAIVRHEAPSGGLAEARAPGGMPEMFLKSPKG